MPAHLHVYSLACMLAKLLACMLTCIHMYVPDLPPRGETCSATTTMDPRNWMHVARASSHGLFLTWTQNLIIYRSYSSLRYLHIRQCLILPNPFYPLFTYLENQLLCSWCEYPSTLVPGQLTTAPPFASSPTLSHPTDQVTIFTQPTSTTPAVLVRQKTTPQDWIHGGEGHFKG